MNVNDTSQNQVNRSISLLPEGQGKPKAAVIKPQTQYGNFFNSGKMMLIAGTVVTVVPSPSGSKEPLWIYESGSNLPDGRGVIEGKFDRDINGKGKIMLMLKRTGDSPGREFKEPILIPEYAEGLFKNGKLEGEGKYTYADKSIDEGIFKDGHLNGKGKRTIDKWSGGGVFDGTFEYGQLVEGELRYSEAYYYKGTFKNNALDGQNCKSMTWEGEKEGAFVQGRLHGQGIYRHPDGTVEEGEFKYGSLIEKPSTWGNLKKQIFV